MTFVFKGYSKLVSVGFIFYNKNTTIRGVDTVLDFPTLKERH
jgi:hypothetical protein